jgi:hypothetical protein
MAVASGNPSDVYNFEVADRFLENLCLHFSVRRDELGQKYLEIVVPFDQMVFVLILLLL